MRSTTADRLADPRPRLRVLSEGEPAPDPRDVEKGLAVLLAMASHVQLPPDRAAERDALAAIRGLQHPRTLDAELHTRAQDFLASLQLLGEPEIRELLHWIAGPAGWMERLRPGSGRRRRRLRLLLVLMVRANATVTRFPELLARIETLCPGGRNANLDGLLDWLPRRVGSRASFELVGAYLEMTRELFANRLVRESSADLEDFRNWSWQRQLLHLGAWRGEFCRTHGDDGNPAAVAGRREFAMARMGLFRRLRRNGGALARRDLDGWGYHDAAPISERGAWGALALVVVLFLGTVALGKLAADRSARLAAHDRSLANQIEEAIADVRKSEAPSPRSPSTLPGGPR